jgi:hypothetical protein
VNCLPEIKQSMHPTAPLRRGREAFAKAPGAAFFFRYTTAPTTNSLSDVTEHEAVIGGLSRLDADCNLGKRIRKSGRYLHAVVEVRRIR